MSNASTPLVTELRVIPVAGRDSMLLNLSGAHAPFFTRNILVLTDSSGHTGVGEVPGGEKIRQTLEDARALVVGQPIGSYQSVLQRVQQSFAVTAAAPIAADVTGVAVPFNSPGTAIDLSSAITGGAHGSVVIVTAPAHGAVTVAGDVLTYVPTSG